MRFFASQRCVPHSAQVGFAFNNFL